MQKIKRKPRVKRLPPRISRSNQFLMLIAEGSPFPE